MRVYLELDVPFHTFDLDDLLEEGDEVTDAQGLLDLLQAQHHDIDRFADDNFLLDGASLRITVVDDAGNSTEARWGSTVHEVVHGVYEKA